MPPSLKKREGALTNNYLTSKKTLLLLFKKMCPIGGIV